MLDIFIMFPPLDWQPPEGRSEPYLPFYVFSGTEEVLHKVGRRGKQRNVFVRCKARFMGKERKGKKSLDGREVR